MKLAKGTAIKILIGLVILTAIATGSYLYLSRKNGQDTTNGENTPYPENAYLLVNVVDKNGNPVSGCTLDISIEYEPPNDYLDYDFEVELKQAMRNMIGLTIAPLDTPATARIIAKRSCGSTSNDYSIGNVEYWQKVESTTTGYAEEVTFVVGDCE